MSDSDRRELNFTSLDEVMAEAERLASGDVRTVGNHTFGEILNHLALSQDSSSGRLVPPRPPFMMRLMMPLIKRMVIGSKPLKPGIKLPPKAESFFWPNEDISAKEGLARLKDSTDYYKANGPVEVHPVFGKLTREESDQLNCRHAALHLGFVHPAPASS